MLLVLGLVLAPIAVVAAWANVELTNTDRFVATLGPLGSDPDVQAYLTTVIVASVDRAVDIDGVTHQAFAAVTGPLGDTTAGALTRLEPAVADGLRSVVARAVTAVVTSDQFAQVWEQVLRSSQQQAIGLLAGTGDRSINAQDDTVVLNIGPLLAQVQAQLKAAGFPLTQLIPTGEQNVVLANVPNLSTARLGYELLGVAGPLLPVLSLVCLVAAVLVAHRRAVATLLAGVGLVVGMGALLIALDVGQAVLVTSTDVPAAVSRAAFDAVTAYLVPTVTALAVVGAALLVGGLVMLPTRASTAVRLGWRQLVAGLQRQGVSSGALSVSVLEGVHRWRVLGWAVILGGSFVLLIVLRPLTPGTVLSVLVLCGVASAVFTILQRPPAPAVPDAPVAPGSSA